MVFSRESNASSPSGSGASAGISGARLANWRTWPARAARSWRRSLQFRTVTVTLGLSLAAVLISSVYMALSIGNDLFTSRVEQVQQDSFRATSSAQNILDSSSDQDRAGIQELMSAARTEIARASSSTLIAGYRSPGQQPSAVAPQDFESPLLNGVISDGLRASVQKNPDEQWWQSVALPASNGGTNPGIIVGTEITLPEGSRYEIYIGYNLSDTEETLLFVQRTLVIGGLTLLILLASVAWVVVRLVANPIRVAAETSQRLASGDLEVRIPEKGEDELATLAQSFNGMADSMQKQIKELADLSQVQQRFVSDVSHELRTPLTTIRLAGDVLYDQRDSYPPAMARTTELLHTQTQRFEILLADLLEISRYDAGSVQLEIEPTSLVHLAEDSIEGVAALAEQKGSEIRLVAPGGYSPVEVDPRRIRRVVRNLLGNAIEHGEGRPIVVTVDSNERAVALTVRDYGLGMTEADSERVFDRFWRADPSRKRTIGGTGLGLAIALEDAQLHGGTLDLWTRVGGGTCFRLTLPRTLGGEFSVSPIDLPPADADGAHPAIERTDAVPPVRKEHS
ncbi:MtrAB system histidine kinase MtrB [Okibacterium sp. HSC-33S16]|uniref:MtrAB system histidine kinase MtrB n=1 Tax=Okibacterium sp. HSC-33S16 TaxID=2910965 RepID=UPI00209E5F9A|nr:MtrAB system histidine kinase MtrB [Okibacterium sp. HSC-33S16]